MNRALRRQQLKDQPKAGAKSTRPAAQGRAIPRTGPAPASARPRSGVSRLVPRFAMEIISELRKVQWPTRDEVIHLTVVVVIVTIIIGAVLGLIDIAFGRLVDEVLLD
jgi:preprotein translocase subunit SecE